jgi:hypothetical protein
VELGDDLVELLLGVLGIGGELGGDVAQDSELLVELYGNADEGAIRAEELVDLFGHGLKSSQIAGVELLTCLHNPISLFT